MQGRERIAEVLSIDEAAQTATIRLSDNSETRDLALPDMIAVSVGMRVRVVDVPGSTPIYAWGVRPAPVGDRF